MKIIKSGDINKLKATKYFICPHNVNAIEDKEDIT